MIFKWLQIKLPRLNILRSSSHSSKASNNDQRQEQQRPRELKSSEVGSSSNNPTTASRSVRQERVPDLDETNKDNPGCCPKTEDLLKGRLSGKVFPSQRGTATAITVVQVAEVRDEQPNPEATPAVVPTTTANCSNVKVRRAKCLFPMLRSPFKWKWRCCCYSHRNASTSKHSCFMHKRANFRKLLIKIHKRTWFTCHLNGKSSSNLPEVPIKKDIPIASEEVRSQLPADSIKEPRKLSLQKAPSTSDPEYWINTDDDFVVLVVNDDAKTKEEGDK